MKKIKTIEDRFWEKVLVTPFSECYEWIGAKYNSGYGVMYFNGRTTGAHRVSYEIHKGKIPDELNVCHTCDNKSCVRPEHLYVATQSENLQDAKKKGRLTQGQWALSKTHCPSGHEYKEGNVGHSKTKYGLVRWCRECKRAKMREWIKNNPEKYMDNVRRQNAKRY